MDIASAKQQIKETVQIYLAKDQAGRYRIPQTRQRPVFLVGAPGLGKTAIMHQVSRELEIGLVSYSMTHHTRQSAIGLPVIVQKEYGGVSYAVSEYTMSEIIASVYECMERTGCAEGILFLDEINCISETLLPPMLLFLQYKTFGGHRLPEGWVVATAGNPKKYNRNARDFEVAIIDRLLYMEVEPDYRVWRQYAVAQQISAAVTGYLDSHAEHFSVIEKQTDYTAVVTPRGWEDLSENIRLREELGLPVDENLVSQYLQHPEIIREFAVWYRLYQSCRGKLDVTSVLAGTYTAEAVGAAAAAAPCERIVLTGMLTRELIRHMGERMACLEGMKLVREWVMAESHPAAETGGDAKAGENDAPDRNSPGIGGRGPGAYAGWLEERARAEGRVQTEAEGCACEILRRMQTEAEGCACETLRRMQAEAEGQDGSAGGEAAGQQLWERLYRRQLELVKEQTQRTREETGNALRFLTEAYGCGNELGLAVSDLGSAPQSAAFLVRFPDEAYLQAAAAGSLSSREEELIRRIGRQAAMTDNVM